MSIKNTRNSEALFANIQGRLINNNLSSGAVIGSSHFQHVLSVWFFKSKEWNQKFAQVCKQISCKFNSVKKISGWFSSICDFNSSKNFLKIVYKCFIYAVKLQLEHILSFSGFSKKGSFANKKATVSVYVTSKINKIFSFDLRHVQDFPTLAHKHLCFCTIPDNVQYLGFIINRDRLSEKTPKGDAIVGPHEKSWERGITRPSATATWS